MANRRMFAKTIIDSDAFLDMPLSTQALYFHLSMRADDDGFTNSPRKIMRMIGASQDEMKVLLSKKFLIEFESGVVVIKHWKIHNYIRKDRYTPTVYNEEKEQLYEKENNTYTLEKPEGDEPEYVRLTSGIPTVDQMDTQVRLGKDRLGKVSEGKDSKEEVSILDDFEYLWEMYPSKKGKGNITKSKKKLNFISDNKDELERCINRYKKYVTNERKNGFESLRYMNGSTFFNSGYVDYLDKNYTEEVEVETDKQNLKRGYDSKQETAEYLGYETVEEMEQALKNKNDTEEEINF